MKSVQTFKLCQRKSVHLFAV